MAKILHFTEYLTDETVDAFLGKRGSADGSIEAHKPELTVGGFAVADLAKSAIQMPPKTVNVGYGYYIQRDTFDLHPSQEVVEHVKAIVERKYGPPPPANETSPKASKKATATDEQ